MRIISAALALVAATSAQAAERRYTVTDFDKIQLDGPFQVSLVTGKPPTARATGAQRALDLVSLDMQGRTLRIRRDRSASGGYPGESVGPLKIELSTHGLRTGIVSGSGSLSIDKAKAMRFEAALSGSGSLRIDSIEADTLFVTMLGSGKVQLGGKAKDLRATVQGTGDLDAGALTAVDAQITSETSGSIQAAVSRTAKVTALGTGDVDVTGSADCTIKALGSGRVACGN
jgi:Putative auto-transporter adhesin, head GIN domain